MHEAERQGKRTFIMMLPGAGSFRVTEQTGRPDYAPFIDATAAKGLMCSIPLRP